MRLGEFKGDEKIFVNANIFIFNALDDEKFGESVTRFLNRIERGEINAVISPLVLDEVFFKILMAETSKYVKKIRIWDNIDTADSDFERVDFIKIWKPEEIK